jgi:hypothetical protein
MCILNGQTLVMITTIGTTAVKTFAPVSHSLPRIGGSEILTYVTDSSSRTLPALIGASGVVWEALNTLTGFPVVFPTKHPSKAQAQ